MLHKVNYALKFSNKRVKNIITPCCGKNNLDGKFVNYKGFPPEFGYCHSCGETTLPPVVYKNEKGEEFVWNNTTNKFEMLGSDTSCLDVIQSKTIDYKMYDKTVLQKSKFIDFEVVKMYYNFPKENHLLKYLRTKYSNKQVEGAKKMYYIGTNNSLYTIFWLINKQGKVKKAKAVLYRPNGKRTDCFKVPYKNEDGYYSCLFGEHLLQNNAKPIVLVESEKTALVASIELPSFTWLAYGGINGLTLQKLESLKNKKIIIVPDMSRKAVDIILSKEPLMNKLNIDSQIFDMTNGQSDQELKDNGWYNCDIEDVIRRNYSLSFNY